MKEVPGLINAKSPKPPSPKPSPKDFVWPSQRDADESVAKKIAATLQELLPKRGWKHIDLAKELWGTKGEKDQPRNTQAVRRWVLAELPIPSERDAGYVAQVLDISMARLLEPEGRFSPLPAMIRPRSDSPRFNPEIATGKVTKKKKAKKAKKAGKTPSGKDRKKQREYNAAYRERKRAEKSGEPVKRKYTKHKAPEGNGAWVLADGVDPPEYTIKSAEGPPGHVSFTLNAVLPHERAMAILHMIQVGDGAEE
jgi:hypothetical protein